MLESLNEAQKKAILEIDCPVIVYAGAGSGKTRTLTYRIAYMIEEKGVNPFNILAITFTNKAANEMKERVKDLVEFDYYALTISTFHSLCARILRKEAYLLGYESNFTILDEDDQLKMISDILAENKEEKRKARGLQKAISYNKCFEITSDDPWERNMTEKYEEKMKKSNCLDFDDLLLKVRDLFVSNREVLEKYRKKFQYILVDEFQDTNKTQYQLVKLLALNHRRLFVVGDDDQSIYAFRGANYENIKLFKKDFPEHLSYTLNQNYRSTQYILDGCNRLIKHNKDREAKELFSNNLGTESDVQVYEAYSEQDEVRYVLDQIELLKNKNNHYDDFAILYRSSSLLRNVELGLIKYGIPHKVYGGVSYLRRREIKDVISYLKLIVNENDIQSFKRVINVPTRGLGQSTIDKISHIKDEYGLTVFSAIDSCKTLVTKAKYDALISFKELILKYRELLDTTDLITLYEELLDELGYLNYLKEEDPDSFEERKDNLNEFKSILVKVETESSDLLRVERLKEAFDEAILSDAYLQNQKEDPHGVTVSTIHSVKGLEFDYVFLIGMEEGIFPSMRSIEEGSLEEERRVAYVATTRAKKRLYLTRSNRRLLYGMYQNNDASMFLKEFLGLDYKKKKKNIFDNDYEFGDISPLEKDIKPMNKKVDEKVDVDPSIYHVGDKVIHKKFGEGIIVAINGDIGSIFFDSEHRMVNLLLTHPALSKLK